MSNLLIVKLSSLGDILQVAPFVENLAKQGHLIDWVVDARCQSITELFPWVHRWIVIDRKRVFSRSLFAMYKELRLQKYDQLYDLQGNIKSSLVTLCAKATKKSGFAFGYAPEWPASFVVGERKKVIDARQMLPVLNKEGKPLTSDIRTIILALTSRWKSKMLPSKTLQELAALLQEQKPHATFIIPVGTEEEKKELEPFLHPLKPSWVVGASLKILLSLMEKADLCITVDSMLMHLAGIAGLPAYSFFGPSKGAFYYPPHLQGGYQQGRCPWKVSFDKRCPKLRACPAPCMQNSLDALRALLIDKMP